MRVLFLSPYVPSRVRIRPYSWIRALAALGHDLHLVALQPPEDRWAEIDQEIPFYEAGSWGPEEADRLIEDDGRYWNKV